ncbi:phosphonate C-P lyase system protein PhnH [Oceanobacillus damuensis]|uniref:phosphonate C-P lyase system protein PhnH n=1 Tax=Oceanobacillus damuensis TaxID=937928 RepID=UPI00082D2767|nr:phosphonate C-P lyase system protein PhnH [Oceanobacillus damuensis]
MAIDQVHDLQLVFRKLLHSMSHPGSISSFPEMADRVDFDLSCSDTTLLCAMALLDAEVTFHILSKDNQNLIGKIAEYTLAKYAPIQEADFVIVLQDDKESDILNAMDQCKIGNLINPQQSSTWIIENTRLSNDGVLKLTGPGIKSHAHLETGFPSVLWYSRNERTKEYPLGIDLIFTDNDGQLVCVPRTTTVEITEVK